MEAYKIEQFLKVLNKNELLIIKDSILDDLELYLVRLEGRSTYLSQSKNNYLECEIAKGYLVEQLDFIKTREIDQVIIKQLYINKESYISSISLLITSISFRRIVNNMYILIKNVVEKNVFKYYINNLENNKVYLEESKIYHLTTILNTNIELITKKYSQGAKAILKNTITTVSNYDDIKLKPFEVSDKNIKDGKFNLIDLRNLFYDRDYFPTSNDIKEYLYKTLTKNNDNFIIMPLFLKGTSPFFNNRNHGYFEVFYDNIDFFSRLLKLLKEISINYEIRIIIPSIMRHECYFKWQTMIDKIIDKSDVLVGILLDDFDIVNEVIDKGKVGCILIDLDYINENNFQLKELNLTSFLDNYLVTLREIRDESNLEKNNLIIKSKSLNCEEVMRKLVNCGYKRFVFNSKNFAKINKNT